MRQPQPRQQLQVVLEELRFLLQIAGNTFFFVLLRRDTPSLSGAHVAASLKRWMGGSWFQVQSDLRKRSRRGRSTRPARPDPPSLRVTRRRGRAPAPAGPAGRA